MKRIILIIMVMIFMTGCVGMTKYMGNFVREPYIGMSERELKEVAPLMYSVNESNYNGRIEKQYCFDFYDYKTDYYVYVEGGKVIAIQKRR